MCLLGLIGFCTSTLDRRVKVFYSFTVTKKLSFLAAIIFSRVQKVTREKLNNVVSRSCDRLSAPHVDF